MILDFKISHINNSWDRCEIFFEKDQTGFNGFKNEFYVYKKGVRMPTFLRNSTKEEKIELYKLIFSTIDKYMNENMVDYIFFNIKDQIPFVERMKVYRRNFIDCKFYTKYHEYEDTTHVYMVKNKSDEKFKDFYGYDEYLFEYVFTTLEDFLLFG